MDPRPQLTTVRLRARLQVRGGALYQAGETVGLDSVLAASLVEQRLADFVTPELVDDPAPAEPTAHTGGMAALEAKVIRRPPKDKMQRDYPAKERK